MIIFCRKISRTACGFRRSRSLFGQDKCPHSPRPYKALSMLCLKGNSPSAEHTTFKESIVCYTLQGFYKVLLPPTVDNFDDNFSFWFPHKFDFNPSLLMDISMSFWWGVFTYFLKFLQKIFTPLTINGQYRTNSLGFL